MEQLEAGIQAIQTSADFKRYLAAVAHFHQYSCANVLCLCTSVVSFFSVLFHNMTDITLKSLWVQTLWSGHRGCDA